MALNSLQKHKLKKFVRTLEKIRGRHTELVSVYIPAGYDLNKILTHLAQEQGTAVNIKDKTTRTHVIDSLEKMIRHLRLFKQTPENGLAVFAGNSAEREDKVDINVWSMEPPMPINVRTYRCDQTFQLDLLKEFLEHKESYGLIILDRKEATIGMLKGTQITELVSMHSSVPGKFKAGGQSASRFARIREEATKEFLNRVNDAAQKEFLGLKNLKGILLGGPGNLKEELMNSNYFNNELKLKVVSIQDLSYTGDFGLKELVERSQEVLSKEVIAEEKKIMDKFLKLLATDEKKVAYGQKEVKNALDLKAVDLLLLSEDIDEKLSEEFEDQAETSGTEVMFISTETSEGIQLKEFGGIAAILRYALH
ncbi:MAG: peptide chain release factor aRF-1 [Nanoarchaeota archaeon]|nr:peptide chain release factor aRF-1 [Nanoarchaeota archaeon]MBU4241830.1 peptide chain release factor aRF-1 [Nanoarchaeota archaeon]MBU4351927.1 peptide chain release factor aRF-1 [Nanoarchaeota archaeon]MBU4456123.1 peptide chain release factor aRF-1 [Nanoarchaeota archaeon]MCG2720275.1 peptide chain release factor aRF-1 [Nanoarchaeota archaeon]